MLRTTSPTHRYVAICNRPDFKGYFFKRFTLPESFTNNSEQACWFFLNCLEVETCIFGCITEEDYNDITDAKEGNNG